MMTPTICTIVSTRCSQSSVSNADANHVKLIHAQHTESSTKANPHTAVAMCASGDVMRQLVPRLRERDDERQVEQQLQWGDRAVPFVRIPAQHPSEAVRPHVLDDGVGS